MSAESGLGPGTQGHRRHTYLFVDTSLLLLDLFFQPSQAGCVRCSAIGLEYLDVPSKTCQYPSFTCMSIVYTLIGEGCDLLLGLFIVCKLLLVLLPTLPSCTRHFGRRGALFAGR